MTYMHYKCYTITDELCDSCQWRSQTFLPTGANNLFCGGGSLGVQIERAKRRRVCEGKSD